MTIGPRRLLLVGAGHANVEVLRRLARVPIPGTVITLLTPGRMAQYSGMLPALVAGDIPPAAARIDALALARAAGAVFIADRATFIDAARRRVFRAMGPPLDYDLIALDIGAAPDVPASPFAIPARPAEILLARLPELDALAAAPEPGHLAVVGGGAGGVELAFALERRLRAVRRAAGHDPAGLGLTLIAGPSGLLRGMPRGLGARVGRLLAGRDIALAPRAAALTPEPGFVPLEGGARVRADLSVWATGVAAPGWLRGSGLTLDAGGFIAVGPTLRSLSHDSVFAVGDIAAFAHRRLPKSGLHAVRQGPVLAANLRGAFTGCPLRFHRPQTAALYLLATGPHHAIGTRNGLVVSGAWVRCWKDRLDRAFIARYRAAPGADPCPPP